MSASSSSLSRRSCYFGLPRRFAETSLEESLGEKKLLGTDQAEDLHANGAKSPLGSGTKKGGYHQKVAMPRRYPEDKEEACKEGQIVLGGRLLHVPNDVCSCIQ